MPRSKNCSTDSAQNFKSNFREYLTTEADLSVLKGLAVLAQAYRRLALLSVSIVLFSKMAKTSHPPQILNVTASFRLE